MIPKFRALHIKAEMICDVLCIDFEAGMLKIKADKQYLFEEELNCPITDCVLMQSTGLFDSAGVEIFEGDVVNLGLSAGDVFCVVEIDPAYKALMLTYINQYEPTDKRFMTALRVESPQFVASFKNKTVIGNRYQQPALLEKTS